MSDTKLERPDAVACRQCQNDVCTLTYDNYTVSHKKEPAYFCLQLRQKPTDLMQFSLLDLALNSTCDGMNFSTSPN